MPGTLISLRNFQYVHVYKSLMGRKYEKLSNVAVYPLLCTYIMSEVT